MLLLPSYRSWRRIHRNVRLPGHICTLVLRLSDLWKKRVDIRNRLLHHDHSIGYPRLRSGPLDDGRQWLLEREVCSWHASQRSYQARSRNSPHAFLRDRQQQDWKRLGLLFLANSPRRRRLFLLCMGRETIRPEVKVAVPRLRYK